MFVEPGHWISERHVGWILQFWVEEVSAIMEATDHANGKVVITLMAADSQFALDDAEKYLVTCNGVKWFALVASALTENSVNFVSQTPYHQLCS